MIIVLGSHGIAGVMSEISDNIMVTHNQLPDTFTDIPSAVVFAGGTDVNPKFYGQIPLATTDKPDKDRDNYEALWFNWCRIRKIPMIGICRGAQFGCIMSGGSLFQHVTGHALARGHDVETSCGKVFNVTSTHHQMMCPDNTEHELLAWSQERLSRTYEYDAFGGKLETPAREAEVVFFPVTNFLSVQYHPEFMHHKEDGVAYFIDTIKERFPNIC